MAVRASAHGLHLLINSAMRPRLCQQSPGIPEISRGSILMRVGSMRPMPTSHKPLVQVTMDTEHKLDE